MDDNLINNNQATKDKSNKRIELFRKSLKIEDRLILSMDVPDKQSALEIIKEISDEISTIKVGLELIYNEGLSIIKVIKKSGYNIMLDAKLMDIPNTVSKALNGILNLGVKMVTLHTFGGSDMLKKAKSTLEEGSKSKDIIAPLLFGVSVLTSLDDKDLEDFGFKINFEEVVKNLVNIAIKSGIDGIICSPNEVKLLRKLYGYNFLIATPGIRLLEENVDDQKRINTPEKAIKDGADFIIVGRSIINSQDKKSLIKLYLEKIKKALIESRTNENESN